MFPFIARAKQDLAMAVVAALVLSSALTFGATNFERPVPANGGPTEVICAFGILDVDEINDADQNFAINLFARFEWKDPREAHSGSGKITKNLNEVWHPHLFFANMQRTWSTFGDDVEISPDGTIVFRQQFWGDFSQPMNLHDFPFDSQRFDVRVVAAGPEEFGEVQLVTHPEIKSFIVETYSVADWNIEKNEVSLEPLILPTGKKVDSFTLQFDAHRRSFNHVVKNIAPLLMIVILSTLVFWLDPKDGGSQLGVAVTSFLTVIAYHVALKSTLPEISYLTRLDVFVFGVTLLVFLTMIEVVITTGLARTQRVAAAQRLDKVCRVIFPGALVLISVYAFILH